MVWKIISGGDELVNTVQDGAQYLGNGILLDNGSWATLFAGEVPGIVQGEPDKTLYFRSFDWKGSAQQVADVGVLGPATPYYSMRDMSLEKLSNGNIIVTWSSTANQQNQFRNEIHQVIINGKGEVQSPIIDVGNVANTQSEIAATTVPLADGGWMVFWKQQIGNSYQMLYSVYDAAGKAIDGQNSVFIGNSSTGRLGDYDVIRLQNGETSLVWTETVDSGSQQRQVYFQRFNTQGEAIANSSMQISTSGPTDDASHVDIAQTELGVIIISWASATSPAGNTDTDGAIYVRSMSGNNYQFVGQIETQVNTTVKGSQGTPTILTLQGGGYAISWESAGDVAMRIFNKNGQAVERQDKGATITDEVTLNNTLADKQTAPKLIELTSGHIVAVWTSEDANGSKDLFQRVFDKFGNVVTGDLLDSGVNVGTTSDQVEPQLLVLPDGGWQVIWKSNANNIGDVFQRQFHLGDDKVNSNEAPIGHDTLITVTKNTSYTIKPGDFQFFDVEGNGLKSVKLAVDSAGLPGKLKLDGVDVTAPVEVTLEQLTNGKLVFVPAINNAKNATFTFQVVDNGGGGDDTDLSPNNFTIRTVGGVDIQPPILPNTAPAGTDTTVTTQEEVAYTFKADDFAFTDADKDALASVIIVNGPAKGKLTFDGAAVTANQEIKAADLGKLSFVGDKDGFGDAYASFTFAVKDNGGVLNGSKDTDATPNTITIKVEDALDVITGSADRKVKDNLIGTIGKEKFDPSKGRDSMTGGGGQDIFVFGKGYGKDRILDFNAKDGVEHDRIDLSGAKAITDFTDLMSHHVKVNKAGDVFIKAGTSSLTLVGVSKTDLTADDFSFTPLAGAEPYPQAHHAADYDLGL